MLVTSTGDCIPTSEKRAAELVGRWLSAVGLDAADALPCDLDDAAVILRDGGQYAIGAEELRALGERGQVPSIAQWDAKDLIAAACCLEARRQWRPTPSVHDPKKTETRLAIEACIAAGRQGLDELREELGRYDLRLALVLITEADNRQLRERMLSTIEALLAIKGIGL